VEGLPFGCAVNPGTGKEIDGPWPTVARRRRLLVVGGGPAGMELAALAREGGHEVELWEATGELGGQLRYAVKAPRHEGYAQYLAWQIRRLAAVGVDVKFDTRATATDVVAAGADVVVVATGATSRIPAIPGVEGEHVLDIRDVLAGTMHAGRRVVIIAQDDHVAPLSVADYLSESGHDVTIVYATQGPAPLLGRYIIGGILGRLDAKGVKLRFMEEALRIDRTTVETRNVYSWRTQTLGEFDSVVLACGSVSDSTLFDTLKHRLLEIHILGDAYAPRRLVFATRQARALAELLVPQG
jgi:NADPH-dependent 2,4-dienoyl-CoA reductase/sulfur reductase-like enzyme